MVEDVEALLERWLPVVGYEGWYEVSDLGQVRSLHHGRSRLLKPVPAGSRYPAVSLYANGTKRTLCVHKLVMAAFVGPRPLGKQIDHIDRDRANPRLTNLRYVLPQENVDHRVAGPFNTVGRKNGRTILTEEQVREIRRTQISHNKGAALYGVNGSTIRAVRIGRHWKDLGE